MNLNYKIKDITDAVNKQIEDGAANGTMTINDYIINFWNNGEFRISVREDTNGEPDFLSFKCYEKIIEQPGYNSIFQGVEEIFSEMQAEDAETYPTRYCF